MIAVWMLSTWQSLGSPPAINIVEFGPGKGTLMRDILRVANKFPKFKNSIHIHMIELSETMRKMQRESTNCFESSKHGLNSPTNNGGINSGESSNMISSDGIKISWHSFLDQVPRDSKPILFIGQEFLDAFPVHQFAYTNKGWREKLIDVDNSEESKFHFRVVLSTSATPAIQALLGEGREHHFSQTSGQIKSNPSLVPHLDPITGKILENQPDCMSTTVKNHPDLVEGDGIEICPLALATSEDIAKRVCQSGGAALFIDYGENFTQSDSVRAFKKHNQVNFLSEPGLVDMTADVDFSAIGRAAESKGAKVMKAIGQGEFLMRMGIVERVEKLIDLPATTDEEANNLVSSMKKLVMEGEGNMGTRFKVMSISHPTTHVAGFN
jgi:NADH dehydrogenase [ubiquinone] 1 alpha subcomplex assembly factor 7